MFDHQRSAHPLPAESAYARLVARALVCWGMLLAWWLAAAGFDEGGGLWRQLANVYMYVGIFAWPVVLVLAVVFTLTAVHCRPRPGPAGARVWPDAARIRSSTWGVGAVTVVVGLIVLALVEPRAPGQILAALLGR